MLLTHLHPDHCSPAFLLFRGWVSDAPLDVLGPPDVVEAGPDVGRPRLAGAVRRGRGRATGTGSVPTTCGCCRPRTAPTGPACSTTCAVPADGCSTPPTPARCPQATVDAVAGAAFDVVLLEETFGDHLTHGTDHLDLATFPEQLRRLREVGAVTADTDVVAVHLSHRNPADPRARPAARGLGRPGRRRRHHAGRARPEPAPGRPRPWCWAAPGRASRARRSGCSRPRRR